MRRLPRSNRRTRLGATPGSGSGGSSPGERGCRGLVRVKVTTISQLWTPKGALSLRQLGLGRTGVHNLIQLPITRASTRDSTSSVQVPQCAAVHHSRKSSFPAYLRRLLLWRAGLLSVADRSSCGLPASRGPERRRRAILPSWRRWQRKRARCSSVSRRARFWRWCPVGGHAPLSHIPRP